MPIPCQTLSDVALNKYFGAAEDRAKGSIYPPLRDIRTISAKVACAVAKKAYEAGVATALPRPHDVKAAVKASMYRSTYRKYR
jgi:malate dehydrogenase (oxaloacetate-decarboxylating)(NADP+)